MAYRGQYEISYILPQEDSGMGNDPMDDDIDIDALNCICSMNQNNLNMYNNNDTIQVVDDNELLLNDRTKPVIEIIGHDSAITFYPYNCQRRYVVIHVKLIYKYYRMSFKIQDKLGNTRYIEISNNRSLVVIDKDVAQLPIVLDSGGKSGYGWHRICLDLPNLMYNAFGVDEEDYLCCRELTVLGSCRIAKIYFQSVLYSDPELPPILRTVDGRNNNK